MLLDDDNDESFAEAAGAIELDALLNRTASKPAPLPPVSMSQRAPYQPPGWSEPEMLLRDHEREWWQERECFERFEAMRAQRRPNPRALERNAAVRKRLVPPLEEEVLGQLQWEEFQAANNEPRRLAAIQRQQQRRSQSREGKECPQWVVFVVPSVAIVVQLSLIFYFSPELLFGGGE
eukprot:Hpha_TRINITY_DN18345_c0_g1::TRINITY_DN18345_c0_g1_i1::g.158122::m.158122